MACCQRVEAPLSFGAKKNVRQNNSQNVYSYLLDASAVVLLYADDAAPNRNESSRRRKVWRRATSRTAADKASEPFGKLAHSGTHGTNLEIHGGIGRRR